VLLWYQHMKQIVTNSLLCFGVNNMDSYQFITDIHNRNTGHCFNLNLYQPSAHLSLDQKGTYHMGIKEYLTVYPYI
jgi:hypothetical protein